MTTQNAWNTPSLTTNGELLIAQATGRPAAAEMVAGSANLTVTNAAGSSTVATVTQANNWVKISSSTASSSASISFTGLSSTYRVYRIEITDAAPATDGVALYMRTSTDNGTSYDSGVSDYQWSLLVTDTSGNSPKVDTADSSIELTDTDLGNGTNETCCVDINLYDPSTAKYTKATWTSTYASSSSAARRSITGGGYRQSTTAVDAIQFLMSSGNISSGTFSLYGLTA